MRNLWTGRLKAHRKSVQVQDGTPRGGVVQKRRTGEQRTREEKDQLTEEGKPGRKRSGALVVGVIDPRSVRTQRWRRGATSLSECLLGNRRSRNGTYRTKRGARVSSSN